MSFKRESFTLIELLVVIAIVGILAGFVTVQLSGAYGPARDAKRKANIDSLRKAILYYGTLNKGVYPIEATTCNVGSNCSTLAPAIVPEYLPSLPVDPVSGYYTYVSVTGSDFTVSAVLSTGKTYSYTASTGFSEN